MKNAEGRSSRGVVLAGGRHCCCAPLSAFVATCRVAMIKCRAGGWGAPPDAPRAMPEPARQGEGEAPRRSADWSSRTVVELAELGTYHIAQAVSRAKPAPFGAPEPSARAVPSAEAPRWNP